MINNAQVDVTTTPALLFEGENGHSNVPQTLLIQNLGPTNYVEVGGPDLVAGEGVRIPVNTDLAINLIRGEQVWAVADTATCDVRLVWNRD